MRMSLISELPHIQAEHFISLGPNCRCAYWIERVGLRQCALTFDWLGNVTLDIVVNTLRDGFDSCFKTYHEVSATDKLHRTIYDNETNLRTQHAFPKNKTIEEFFPEFRKKFNARTQRFQNIMATSRSVCFIFRSWGSPEYIQEIADRLHKMYPRLKMTFVQVLHNDSINEMSYTKLRPYAKLYRVIAYDKYSDDKQKEKLPKFWVGNVELWLKIFRNMQLIKRVPFLRFFHRTKIIPANTDVPECPMGWAVRIKNYGDVNNNVSIQEAHGVQLTRPTWFNNAAGGGVMISGNTHRHSFTFQATSDGTLKLYFSTPLKAPSWSTVENIYTDYSSICVDGVELLSKPVSTTWDDTFVHVMPVTDGQIVSVTFEQCPHKYTDTDRERFIAAYRDIEMLSNSQVDALRAYLESAK